MADKKKTKISYATLSKQELLKTIQDLGKELSMKKMEHQMAKLKDIRALSKTRDAIARAKTVLRMKEMENA